MAPAWHCFRTPAHDTAFLRLLRDDVRANDPGMLWSFDRDDSGTVLRFHTQTDAAASMARSGVEFTVEPSAPPAGIAQIAATSSDLALDLDPADWLPFTASHLRDVTGLVHPKDRGQFLFHCWERSTSRLSPAARVRLLQHARAARWAEPSLTGQAALSWRRHRLAMRRCNVEEGAPHYRLFEQVHLVHERLAIDPATRATAAVLVRSEFSGEAKAA